MPSARTLAFRTGAIGLSVVLTYTSGAIGFNDLASSTVSLAKQAAKRSKASVLPAFADPRLPIFKGANPLRDGSRSEIWRDSRLDGLRVIETARALRQSLEHGEAFAAIGAFAMQISSGPNSATASGGSGYAGEGTVSSGGDGSVNTRTGNRATSVSFAGWTSRAGMQVPFTLTHNSSGTFNGLVGRNWSSSYEAEVGTASGQTVVRMPDGLSVPFPIAGGRSTAPGRYEIYTPLSGGGSTLRFKDRTVWNFNSAGQMTSVVDRSGNTVSLTRNAAGLLTKVTDPVGHELNFSYYPTNRIKDVTDPMNRVWTLHYDTSGRLDWIQYPDMANGLGAPKQEFGYDGTSDRIITEKDLRGKTWTTEYNGLGLVAKETNPLLESTLYLYNGPATTIKKPMQRGSNTVHNYANNRLASIVDEAGYADSFTSYDADNNVLTKVDKHGKEWTYTWDNGNMLTKTDPLNHTWTYEYETTNELKSQTSPLGFKTTYGYDTAGRRTTTTDHLGHVRSTVHYDNFGQADSVKDALNRETTMLYSNGIMYRRTEPSGVYTNYSYDADMRLNAKSNSLVKLWLYGKDGWGRPNGITYPGGAYTLNKLDGNGNLVSARDEINRTTTYTYDDANRLKTTTNARGDLETRSYNADGLLISVTDGNLHQRSYGYDDRGDLSISTLADGSNQQYSHSAIGYVSAIRREDNTVIYLPHDDAYRLTLVNYPGYTPDESFTYDADDRKKTMVDQQGTTVWTYDGANRVTQIDFPNKAVAFEYFNDDQRLKVTTFTNGNLIGAMVYGYDAYGRPNQITNRFGEATFFTYDALGRLGTKEFGNGTKETYGYDDRDRRKDITLKAASGATLRTENYVLTDASQVDSHTVNGAQTTYGYDLAGQLTSESRSGYSGSYTYDANGNRLTRTVGGVTETYAYDAGDKLQTVKVGTATQRSYTYNAAGTVLTMTTQAGTTNLGIDEGERLKTIAGPNSFSAAYNYNGEGTRVFSIENNDSRGYLRDGTGVTSSILEDGSAGYTPGTSENRGGVSTFYHGGLKNLAAQTSTGAPAISASRVYDAFGNFDPAASTGTFKGPFGYGGTVGYREDASGLKLVGRRMYDSGVGRFLSRDPVRDGRNWYAYCESDPVSLSDPTGEMPEKFFGRPVPWWYTPYLDSIVAPWWMPAEFSPVQKRLPAPLEAMREGLFEPPAVQLVKHFFLNPFVEDMGSRKLR